MSATEDDIALFMPAAKPKAKAAAKGGGASADDVAMFMPPKESFDQIRQRAGAPPAEEAPTRQFQPTGTLDQILAQLSADRAALPTLGDRARQSVSGMAGEGIGAASAA